MKPICRGRNVYKDRWEIGWYREYKMFDRWAKEAYRDGVNYFIDDGSTGGSQFVIPETVTMYTGIKDSNGKMIFGNDVVRYTCVMDNEVRYDDYLIVWHNGGFYAKNLMGNTPHMEPIAEMLPDGNDRLEVIFEGVWW